MKKLPIISFLAIALVIFSIGCGDDIKRKRGRTYMPDMENSRAYETYSPSPVFIDGQTNREPVAGTVKRGDVLPFHLGPDPVGDTTNYFASRQVRNPLPPLDTALLKEAERLYLINCGICHGAKLDGNGPLYNGGNGPFPSAPKNLIADPLVSVMPEGQMFFSVTYGKNLMGSYASQLSAKQRWMVVAYVKSKQSPTKPATDTAAAKTVAAK